MNKSIPIQKKGMEVWSQFYGIWPEMPLVISYFTDLYYLREAFELVRTLQLFRLDYVIEQVKNLATWERNTNHKPTFIQRLHDRFPERPLLWLDADARVRRFPRLLVNPVDGIAYHLHKGKRALSGTVYLPPGKVRGELLRTWIDEVTRDPKATDQVCLERAMTRCKQTPVPLPESYCWIYDLAQSHPVPSPADTLPVIEHMQASRWTMNKRKGT